MAYVSNRYLNQVFVLDVNPQEETASMRLLGGFDERAFLDGDLPSQKLSQNPQQTVNQDRHQNLHQILRVSCGTASCHQQDRGGFYAGKDPLKTYFSAIENSTAGDPSESIMLRAAISKDEGGFADNKAGANFHASGQVISKSPIRITRRYPLGLSPPATVPVSLWKISDRSRVRLRCLPMRSCFCRQSGIAVNFNY